MSYYSGWTLFFKIPIRILVISIEYLENNCFSCLSFYHYKVLPKDRIDTQFNVLDWLFQFKVYVSKWNQARFDLILWLRLDSCENMTYSSSVMIDLYRVRDFWKMQIKNFENLIVIKKSCECQRKQMNRYQDTQLTKK